MSAIKQRSKCERKTKDSLLIADSFFITKESGCFALRRVFYLGEVFEYSKHLTPYEIRVDMYKFFPSIINAEIEYCISDDSIIFNYRQPTIKLQKVWSGIRYRQLSKGECEVIGFSKYPTNPNMVIPENIAGMKVVSIGVGAFRNLDLQTLILPNSVKEIKRMAFYGNPFKVVHLGWGVERIGEYAFDGCPLQEVQLPDSIQHIEDYAFSPMTEVKSKNAIEERLLCGVK